MSDQLILYNGPHCSLCEKAKAEIWPVLSELGLPLQEVDITSDVELLRRYRLTIPVVALGNGQQLNWPFDAEQLLNWIQQHDS